MHASNNELPAVSFPSNRRSFYYDINLIFNCEFIKTRTVEPEPKQFWIAGAGSGAKNF